LHGNCQRYTHWLIVDSVQVGGSTLMGSQTVLAGQGATAAPPVHVLTVWLWQSIPAKQSASAVQVCASAVAVRAVLAASTRIPARVLVVFMGGYLL
jgi:hypothetical protein